MWNNEYQMIGNGYDLMHVSEGTRKQMCRKYSEIGGKIFVTENSGIWPEVKFVDAVTAGGSVKFLPAVQISPETMRFTI